MSDAEQWLSPMKRVLTKYEVGTYFKLSSSALSWRSLRQLPTFWSDICMHFQPEDESSRFFVILETLISLYNDRGDRFLERLVPIHQTTPCYKPEGHNLKFHFHENLTHFYLFKLMHTNKSLEEES
jgi:hypothetical protein